MIIFEWNIGMAATIPSNQGYNLLPWIIDEIIKEEPDGIILTEFVVSKGIDYYIRELEKITIIGLSLPTLNLMEY